MPTSHCLRSLAPIALFLALCPPTRSAPAEVVSGPTIGGERHAAQPEQVASGWLERRWAQSDLERLAAAVEARIADRGALPAGAGFEALAPDFLPDRTPVDPWGRPYRLVTGPETAVASAGPDGGFGTDDDLVIRVGAPGAPAAPESPRAASAIDRLPERPARPIEGEVLVTHERMLTLSAALEAFRSQRGHYPVGTDAAGLSEALVPEHLEAARFSATDGWGAPWRYRSNDVGTSYSLVSAGSDGVFESLVPLRSGPVQGAARDLVVVDGRFARWPQGVASPASLPDRGPAPPRATPPARPAARPVFSEAPPRPTRTIDEPGKQAATTQRMERIAEALAAFRAREGRYPELDDAARLVRVLSLSVSAEDAWGRPFDYLSLGAGRSCVLVSRGQDGRLGQSLEDYLNGAEPRGDLVFLNARRR